MFNFKLDYKLRVPEKYKPALLEEAQGANSQKK